MLRLTSTSSDGSQGQSLTHGRGETLGGMINKIASVDINMIERISLMDKVVKRWSGYFPVVSSSHTLQNDLGLEPDLSDTLVVFLNVIGK